MQFLLDLLPLIVFFTAFKLWGIYVATAALVVVTVLQTAIIWVVQRRVSRMGLATAGLVLVFGGATLVFQDELFILIKPTVAYLLFAVAFALSRRLSGQALIQRMLGHAMRLDALRWSALNRAWVLWFAFLAVLNLVVAFSFDRDTWVSFKLFGLMGLMLLFVLAQGVWLTRHAEFIEDEDEEDA